MITIYVLLALGIAYYFYKNNSNESPNDLSNDYSNVKLNFAYLNSLPSPIKTFINSVMEKFPFTYFDKFKTGLPIALIYSVLYNESRGQIINKVPNNLIIGDNGNSIGFMQVNKFGAVKEYAAQKGLTVNEVFQAVHSETENFTVGLFYLNLCYQKSLKDSSNIIHTTLKRYNGGIGQTETSVNNMATSYANKGIEFYNHLIKIFS